MTFMGELPKLAVRYVRLLTPWLGQPQITCIQYGVVLDPSRVYVHIRIDDGFHPTLFLYDFQPFFCLCYNLWRVYLHIKHRW